MLRVDVRRARHGGSGPGFGRQRLSQVLERSQRRDGVLFSDGAGGGHVKVFQGSSTLLLFAIWRKDPSSEVCTQVIDQFGNVLTVCSFTRSLYDYGWGEIPSSHIQFTETSAHLATLTGPDFSSTRCTTDHSTSTPTTTCEPGPASFFDLTWDENDLYSTSGAAITRRDYGAFIFWSTGTSQTQSAFTNGTALGRTLFDAPGGLGNGRGRIVIRDVPPAP